MNKYQIIELAGEQNHAGSKATADAAEIVDELGFLPLYLKMNNERNGYLAKIQRQWDYFFQWRKIVKSIDDNSIVFLQHPFHYPQLTREHSLKTLRKKGVKFVCLIHDVEKLRAFRYNGYYQREFEFMLDIGDFFIVHNNVMKAYFESLGISSQKIIVLEIFDYLLKNEINNTIEFEKSIAIAGNLDTTKCGYIGELKALHQLKINLYGINFNESMREYKNIVYHGVFPPDDVPKQLTRGFGLVWDGESIMGCVGKSGQYLKYNNPHKLSLYLASGIPVVIWKDAAEASFVEENKLGYCVTDLKEAEQRILKCSRENYVDFQKNVLIVGEKIKSGFYLRQALRQVSI
jgi:hypothetical protein